MTTKTELVYYNQNEVWGPYSSTRERNRADQILKMLPEKVFSILDVGCGSGVITNSIESPFVVGLDAARTPLMRVKKHAIQGSIDSFPLKANEFDLVIITEVLEHLDNETFIKAIQEVERLAASYLLISVPFDEDVESTLCKCIECGNLFNPYYHCQRFGSLWFAKFFFNYQPIKIVYSTLTTPSSKWISSLKHKLGVYEYSDTAVCNECGNMAVKPNRVIEFFFNGMQLADRALKRLLNVQEPYHQIALLVRCPKE